MTDLDLGQVKDAANDLQGMCSDAGYRDAVRILVNAAPALIAEIERLRAHDDERRFRDIAAALMGVVHEIEDLDDAETVTRRAIEWEKQADHIAARVALVGDQHD